MKKLHILAFEFWNLGFDIWRFGFLNLLPNSGAVPLKS